MPLYEYQCQSCQHRFEVIQKYSDPLVEICKSCGGGPVVKLLSSPAIQFKGSGFYITDYARKDSGESRKDSGESSSKSGSGSSSESESKPATSTDSGASASSTAGTTPAPAASPAPAKSTTSDKKSTTSDK
jgi:putative FmdB family regulatory protein